MPGHLHAKRWRSPITAAQWRSSLERFAAVLVDKPVTGITVADVRAVPDPIWHTTTETATRVRRRLEVVLDMAAAEGLRPEDAPNPAAWAKLKHHFPAKSDIAPVQHHTAMPHENLSAFMAKLRPPPGLSALALRFLIATATRSAEARGATWAEIDLARRTWTIPASRMKAGRQHTVPLSSEALAVLSQVEQLRTLGGLVFPSTNRRGEPASLSDVAMAKRNTRNT